MVSNQTVANFIHFDTHESVVFEDCHNGEVKSVSVSGCQHGSKICTFNNGRRHSIGMNFIPEDNFRDIVANAQANLLGILTLHLPKKDVPVCDLVLPNCPLEAGKEYRFENPKLDVQVPWWVPHRIFKRMKLTAVLEDKYTKKTVACMRMLATVQF
ncbi:hypothetical protein RDWZM_005015 [Blomia tropicalis]|uniref:MD-2-related lipid-recognition domain-containing protein n=1 Tax=Blomia tropicalis TaxID=40697 RepID=A0A9Q0RKI2_BLOTA|nr:hypothetical protein RDWZM_005015 [Blomia tropicalis]